MGIFLPLGPEPEGWGLALCMPPVPIHPRQPVDDITLYTGRWHCRRLKARVTAGWELKMKVI